VFKLNTIQLENVAVRVTTNTAIKIGLSVTGFVGNLLYCCYQTTQNCDEFYGCENRFWLNIIFHDEMMCVQVQIVTPQDPRVATS
jgi:hypothetical protein